MRRSSSLPARLALVTALALLVAQGLSLVLLARAEERAADARAVAAAVALIEAATDPPEGFGRRRRARLAERLVRRTEAPEALTRAERLRRAEPLAAAELEARGLATVDVRVGRAEGVGMRRREGLIVSVRTGAGDWINAGAPLPKGRRARLAPLAAQTVVTYLLLLVPVLWIGRHVARPLAALTERTSRYRLGDPPMGAVSGPEDVAALGRAISAMQSRIAADLAARDALLGAIGHDLRTPLTSLRLRAEQVADEALRAKMIQTIARTQALLEDTLTLARLGRAEGEPVRVDLAALAEEGAEAARAAGQSVRLGTSEPVAVQARPAPLARALQNLIENAHRYAGGGTVTVQREGDEAVLSVSDEGPGLPAGLDLTQPFARADASRNRATGGAGLGLAIAQRAVEGEGGTLALGPRPGGGTAASIRLPLG